MYAPDEPLAATPSVETVVESAAASVGDAAVGTVVESAADYGGDATGETRLQKALLRSVTPAAALAYMVFILLYFPCIATFFAIRRESGSWKWAILTAVYTIILAWVAAFIVYHLAMLFGLGG